MLAAALGIGQARVAAVGQVNESAVQQVIRDHLGDAAIIILHDRHGAGPIAAQVDGRQSAVRAIRASKGRDRRHGR